jgi:branched-chain amino acid transport system permease protein
MPPRPWLAPVAVASLAAPFLLLVLQPDFVTGQVSLAWDPQRALKFLSVLAPALVVGLLAGLAMRWHERTVTRPIVTESVHAALDRPWILGLVVLTLSLVGLFLGPKALSLGTFVCLHMILALGLNVTVGMTGLLVLGYSAFYAAGAYTAALSGLPWIAALPLAGLVAALLGWLVGLPCLRLRGDYLAIVTLGFAEAFRELVRNLEFSGGDMGLVVPTAARFGALGPLSSNHVSWMAALVATAGATLAIHHLYHSRVGRAWIAIREDEVAAGAMGIPVVRLKLLAFTVSSGMAGLAGALFAGFAGFVDPSTSTFEQSVLILAMTILGGLGSIPGSLVGAALLYLLPSFLRDWFPAISDYRLLFFGMVLVAMMVFRPQGLLGSPRHKLELEGGK